MKARPVETRLPPIVRHGRGNPAWQNGWGPRYGALCSRCGNPRTASGAAARPVCRLREGADPGNALGLCPLPTGCRRRSAFGTPREAYRHSYPAGS